MDAPDFNNTAFSETSPPQFSPGNTYLSFMCPSMILALSLLIAAPIVIYKIYEDYRAFLRLGPGGTPQTLAGYARISFLRLFALKNPCMAAPVPLSLLYQQGYLETKSLLREKPLIPWRGGSRPIVAGIAPHRQLTQRGTPENWASLVGAIRELAGAHPSKLGLGTSCFEKHTEGIFSRNPVSRTCNGEVCHSHPSDGSMHMSLHPADAKVVIGKGWGERHPLAKGGWLARFVPSEFVMIYAPRTEEELATVIEIIKAAIWWVDGLSIDGVVMEETPKGSLRGVNRKNSSCEWRASPIVRQG